MTSGQWVPEVGGKAIAKYTPKHGHSAVGHEVEVKALFTAGDKDFAAVEYQCEYYCLRVDMLSEPTTEEDRAVEEMREVMRATPGACHNEISLRALYRANFRKQPQPADDMADPANWRAGDLITSTEKRMDITPGKQYTFIGIDEDGDYEIKADDVGDLRYLNKGKAVWHSRP